MTTIKTAISMQKPLFEQVNQIAQELQISRSRLFVLAIEAFIKQYQNKHLLESINSAYDEISPDEEENEYTQKRQAKHQNMVRGEW